MAEPTNTQLLDAIQTLSQQIGALATAVDDVRASLTMHRQDSETRTTNLDISLRGELALVRAHVDAFQPQLDEVKAKQVSGDQAVVDLHALVDSVRADQGVLKNDVLALSPKLDEVRAKQDLIIEQQNAAPPA